MKYTLHPRAEQDIADVLDFYLAQAGRVVAGRFLAEFERTATLLMGHPDLGVPTSSGRRTIPLRIFPYLIVYRHADNEIQILIVRHQHRKPSYARNR